MVALDGLDPTSPHFGAAVDLSTEVSPASPGDRDEVAATFERHANRPEYRGFVATREGEVVGVAYGYRSEPGQFVHTRLREALSHHAARRWLADCFEVAELGVRPDARGEGVGSELHDALLTEVDAETAVLTVDRGDDASKAFFRDRGWREVGGLTVGGDDLAVLGRDL